MKKRAQGLSLNTIIIAALVLLVLVILAVIFTGRMGKWGIATQECTNQGGTCMVNCTTGYTQHPTYQCYGADGATTDQAKTCCMTAIT